ncbi:MAG: DUF2157 domain-containing protein [Cyclobacteriaceae bacterium]
MMNLQKDLHNLVNAEVISSETADKIRDYYKAKEKSLANPLMVVFAVIGATLVGLGIILIIAHNWDNLPLITKTIFAFLPLLIGQLLCAFTIIKKPDHTLWKEASSTFLFFSIAAGISLIGQVYHIPGNLTSFMFVWMLLALPIIYLLKSSTVSLLYIIGVTFYGCEGNYFSSGTQVYDFWIFLAAAIPNYFFLVKNRPESNYTYFHHWILPASLLITLGTLAKDNGELILLAYVCLLGVFYLLGSSPEVSTEKARNNGYLIIGSSGMVGFLTFLTFDGFWSELRGENFAIPEVIMSPEFIAVFMLSAIALFLLVRKIKSQSASAIKPMDIAFLVFIVSFIVGLYASLVLILINLMVFAIGIWYIKYGSSKNHLGFLNYGLMIISLLIICRVFDSDLSFVIRGILFVLVGAGFFVSNYQMLKRRKADE